MSAKKDCLSAHDRAVLNSIFDPSQTGTDSRYSGDEKLPDTLDEPVYEKTPLNEETKQLEIDAIIEAEKLNFGKALELLNLAIEKTPYKASLWNNRGQVHRLMGNEIDAIKDLEETIARSNSKGQSGCRAHCQLGLIKRKQKLEQEARNHFEIAAQLGSSFAKNQLIEMNPYAALCNEMFREMLNVELKLK